MENIAHKGQNSELYLPMGAYPGHYSNHKLRLQVVLYISVPFLPHYALNSVIIIILLTTMHMQCYPIYNAARAIILIY